MGLGPEYTNKTVFGKNGLNITAGAASVYDPINYNYEELDYSVQDVPEQNNLGNSNGAEIIVQDYEDMNILFNEKEVKGEIDPDTGKIKPGTDKVIVATTKRVNINPVTGQVVTEYVTNPYLKDYDGMTELQMKEAMLCKYFNLEKIEDLDKLTASEILEFMVDVEIEYYGTDGEIHHKVITVHKEVADRVKTMMHELAESKFPIYRIEGFNRKTITDSDGKLSQHSFGLAIDINADTNPRIYDDAPDEDQALHDPKTDETALSNEEAEIFIKYGYFWGGTWTSGKKDYMHISCNSF